MDHDSHRRTLPPHPTNFHPARTPHPLDPRGGLQSLVTGAAQQPAHQQAVGLVVFDVNDAGHTAIMLLPHLSMSEEHDEPISSPPPADAEQDAQQSASPPGRQADSKEVTTTDGVATGAYVRRQTVFHTS